jgi:tetratricopeptide (TPR) repeat protein
MPRIASADIAHAALSDHRILRRQDQLETGPARNRVHSAPWGGGLPVVSFFEPGSGAPRDEMERDLGLALVLMAITRSRAGESRLDLTAAARPLLEEALRTWPEDVAAWEANGSALHLSGLWQEALAAFDEALARAPNRETALSGAALTAEELRRSDAAIGYWQRLLEVNPHSVTAHARLATLLGARERWPEALREGQEVLRLNPFAVEARVFVAQCYLRLGNVDQARGEFARVEALKPADLLELRHWFERETRISR